MIDDFLWSYLKNKRLFSRIYKKPFLNDEPKIFNFGLGLNSAKICSDGNLPDLHTSGSSASEEVALLKAVFEAIERISLAEFRFKNFRFDSADNLSIHNKVVDPSAFCYFSNKQLENKKFDNFCYSSKCKFYWTRCVDLIANKDILLPSQTIYCPYKYSNNEKTIAFPITTGASAGENIDEAIYKGFCEVIERDSYMANYLLKLDPQEIVYSNIHSIKILTLHTIFKKYSLNIRSFILNSDLDIPTVLSVIIDTTGKGPALSVGLKTDWNLENAIVGSIEEASQIRNWIRINMIRNDWVGNSYTTNSMLKRAFLWKDLSNIDKLDFILETTNQIFVDDYDLRKYGNSKPLAKLTKLKIILQNNNFGAYYKDITSRKFKSANISVVKCVIPVLHPMFINQDFPYLGGQRIKLLMKKYKVGKLNLYPHPFL